MNKIRAVVSSDLHYTADRNGAELIMPLIRHCDEALSAFCRQIMNIHPDVLILTGDHTASGKLTDRTGFASYLKRIRESGTEIIMTTGNHDFDRCTRKEYTETYGPFLKADKRDSASLSYTRILNNIMFLSMDDHCHRIEGRFQPETMQWLEANLKLAEKNGLEPVFLSHHSVFFDHWTGNSRFYQIQNMDLIPLLHNYGVRLALTGHQHFPAARKKYGLTEIIVPMPFQGEYTFGILEADENEFIWRTDNIDFDRFGTFRFASEASLRRNTALDFLVNAVLESGTDTDPEHLKEYRRLLTLWYRKMNSVTLSHHDTQIINDPYYPALMKHIASTPYGIWIKEMTEENNIRSDLIHIPYHDHA